MRKQSKLQSQRNIMHLISMVLCCLVLILGVAYTIYDVASLEISELLSPQPVEIVSYKTGSGDSLWTIAANTVLLDEDIRDKIIAIRKLNGLTPNQILQPGQVVQIPVKNLRDKDFRYTYIMP